MRWLSVCAAVVLLVVGVIVGVIFARKSADGTGALMREAERAALRSDYRSVERLVSEILTRDPDSHRALLLVGQAAAEQGQADQAVAWFDRIPDDGSSTSIDARCAAGEVLLLLGHRPADAERQFQRALGLQPDQPIAHERLAFLYGLSGRSWDAIPHRLQLLDQGIQVTLQLFLLSLGEHVTENRELVNEFRATAATDDLLRMAVADIAIKDKEFSEAVAHLQPVIRSRPDLTEAHSMLGQALLESGTDEQLLAWNNGLPTACEQHPGIWENRGRWAERRGQTEVAIRCLWESVRLDPNRSQTNYQLAQLLSGLGRAADARPFRDRAQQLLRYEGVASQARSSDDPQRLQSAAEAAEALGLLRESRAWYGLVLAHSSPTMAVQQALERLESRLAVTQDPSAQEQRTVPDANPALALDLSRYPLPTWHTDKVDGPPRPLVNADPAAASVSFRDDATSAGLQMSWYAGNDPMSFERTMRETLGGGAGVLDMDSDGWPDLFLTQGCPWPPGSSPSLYLDRIFRNTGDGRFLDATVSSGIRENQFSHGVAAGDLDCDGFPDLYVTNSGPNSMFRNNGDGTFSDVTEQSGTAGAQWSTSCVMADLNGDTWPDVYVVNYLTGSDVFERICRDAGGNPGVCQPHDFAAEQDRLYLSTGDGHFEDATSAAGIVAPDGKGLGVVAADFGDSGRLSLFVANDTVANHFYRNTGTFTGGGPLFEEVAFAAGVAVNSLGLPEACMGIAAGDADGDQRLDLFVTNFYQESNTLYLSQPDGSFLDRTTISGLREPSLPMLGFGTQFLDGELDGRTDLVVTNGHVHAVREENVPHQMPPQYFQNTGGGRFREVNAGVLGPFFAEKSLGRGLSLIDWNRDGLEDVVITHLDRPVALLTNTTTARGNFLAVQLRAVRTARDATGTSIRVTAGDHSVSRQLTAGDGYLASNERQLIVGLGEHDTVDRLDVRWPSGLQQTIPNPPLNATVILIEGRSHSFRIPELK